MSPAFRLLFSILPSLSLFLLYTHHTFTTQPVRDISLSFSIYHFPFRSLKNFFLKQLRFLISNFNINPDPKLEQIFLSITPKFLSNNPNQNPIIDQNSQILLGILLATSICIGTPLRIWKIKPLQVALLGRTGSTNLPPRYVQSSLIYRSCTCVCTSESRIEYLVV